MHLYICTSMRLYIYTYIRAYRNIHIYRYTYTCLDTYMYTYMCVYICICVNANVYTWILTYIYIYVYRYAKFNGLCSERMEACRLSAPRPQLRRWVLAPSWLLVSGDLMESLWVQLVMHLFRLCRAFPQNLPCKHMYRRIERERERERENFLIVQSRNKRQKLSLLQSRPFAWLNSLHEHMNKLSCFLPKIQKKNNTPRCAAKASGRFCLACL